MLRARLTKWSCLVLVVLLALVPARPASAGRLGGQTDHHDIVLGHSSDRYTITLVGGEVARVFVSGDGSTDLDLFVFDDQGNRVACDTDPTDDCLVIFVPRWTGRYTIVIRNLGSVPNIYDLTTN
jgi:hypothetical protein